MRTPLRTAARLLVGAIALTASCSNGPPKPPPATPRSAHTVDLDALVPADVDLVVRADLARARSQGVYEELIGMLRGAQLSEAMLATTASCLEKAEVATLALRLGPQGFDGDVLLRLRLGDNEAGVPCGAPGWRSTGDAGGATVFEPATPELRRSAPAMMLRDRSGNLLISTPGQIDSVLRLVREGADAEPLRPPTDGMIGLAARVDEAQLPAAWREKAPTLTALARGLSRFSLRIDVGDRITARAMLTYVERADADAASRTLRAVRDALASSDRESFKRGAEAAHAEKIDETIRVDLTLPRGL